MLNDLDVNRILLLTNNPKKLEYLQRYLINAERVPNLVKTNQHNLHYQRSKADKLGHLIPYINTTGI